MLQAVPVPVVSSASMGWCRSAECTSARLVGQPDLEDEQQCLAAALR